MEELNEGAGFYKFIGNEWHGGIIVNFPDGRKLHWELRDTYEYPYEGWVWLDERPEDLLRYS